MAAPREHSIIAGKYRLIRQLGQGGMGSVWLAEHLTLCSQVAIKLIHVDMTGSAEVLGRFLREAQAAASLRSPHVVQILDHGVDDGTPYIAMELLDGESLADRLARLGRLDPVALARIMTQIGRAIGRAHEAGIVHRDLKPDNVFLVHNDDDELTKVLDFGIAKATLPGRGGLDAAASSNTRTGAVLGTPYYMSPEQAEGARSLDHRSDIWAMGVIAFECLLGRKPFDAETLGGLLLAICTRAIPIPSQLSAVPPGFDAWFARACNRDLSQRFSSARDAAQELKRICESSPALSGPHSARAVSIPDASGGVPAVSGPIAGSAFAGSAVPMQSVAGLSASQLEAIPTRKRSTKPALFALLGGGALLLVGAALAWSHFESSPSNTAPAAPLNATSAAPSSARGVEPSLPPAPPPVPVLSASAATSEHVSTVSSAHAPTTNAGHPPAKRPPAPATTSATKPAWRPSVNLGI